MLFFMTILISFSPLIKFFQSQPNLAHCLPQINLKFFYFLSFQKIQKIIIKKFMSFIYSNKAHFIKSI